MNNDGTIPLITPSKASALLPHKIISNKALLLKSTAQGTINRENKYKIKF